jgi:hypothetical protein
LNWNQVEKSAEGLQGNLIIRVYHRSFEELRNNSRDLSEAARKLLSDQSPTTSTEFAEVLRKGEPFRVYRFKPMGDVHDSWGLISSPCSGIVGERMFRVASDGLLAPRSYVYRAVVLGHGGVDVLFFAYFDTHDLSVAKRLSQFFQQRDNRWYWRSRESVGELYDALSGDDYRSLPEPLVKLREGWDHIMSSLEYRCPSNARH